MNVKLCPLCFVGLRRVMHDASGRERERERERESERERERE